MANKGERVALLIGGGIAGFLIGYFLRRPKAMPAGVTLEQLQIAPATAYPGDEVTIACIATNRGEGAASFTVIATVGNNILEQEVFLEPQIPTEVVFVYTVLGLVSSRTGSPIGNMVGVPYYVTVSVGDLVGNFELVEAPVGSLVYEEGNG